LIIIDDGSTDDTAEIALDSCNHFLKKETKVIRFEKNRGKDFAVNTELLASKGEIALFSDADLSTLIEELHKLINPIEKGGIDVEFLYVANYRNLKLKEIPVRWNHCDGTKVSAIRDSYRMFNEVRQIRNNAKNSVYDSNVRDELFDFAKSFA
jgi:glycosyltransferase involved in cell wall biosynthesis